MEPKSTARLPSNYRIRITVAQSYVMNTGNWFTYTAITRFDWSDYINVYLEHYRNSPTCITLHLHIFYVAYTVMTVHSCPRTLNYTTADTM